MISTSTGRYWVSAGTHIGWSAYQIQHRKDLWGEDADEWRPHRWIDSAEQVSERRMAAFQAWGMGPRIVSLYCELCLRVVKIEVTTEGLFCR